MSDASTGITIDEVRQGMADCTAAGKRPGMRPVWRAIVERTGRYPHIARAAERLREHRDAPLPCLDHDQIQALRERAREAVSAAEGGIPTFV